MVLNEFGVEEMFGRFRESTSSLLHDADDKKPEVIRGRTIILKRACNVVYACL